MEWIGGYVRVLSDPNKRGFIALVCIFAAICVILVITRKNLSDFKNEGDKNGGIEAMRFLISMCVVMHHYGGYSPGGYLGVDFFFILSGFFMMKHFDQYADGRKPAAEEAARYTLGRYRRIIPHYIFSFIFCIVLILCIDGRLSVLGLIQNNIWEIFMLEAFGVSENLIIGPGWYCSALLISGFAVYYFLAKSKQTYLYFVAPCSLMGIFAWMMHQFGNLNRWLQYDTYVSTGVLRGFAELGLGCICYEAAAVVLKNRKIHRWQSTVLEAVCFSYILYTIFLCGSSVSDFICVIFMAALITSLFMKTSLWSHFFTHPVFQYMGKISMAIFLNHTVLLKINWSQLFCISWHASFASYLLLVVLFSSAVTELVGIVEHMCTCR